MGLATELYQEGMIIPSLKLCEAGRLDGDRLKLILRHLRTPDERRGDFEAQMAT